MVAKIRVIKSLLPVTYNVLETSVFRIIFCIFNLVWKYKTWNLISLTISYNIPFNINTTGILYYLFSRVCTRQVGCVERYRRSRALQIQRTTRLNNCLKFVYICYKHMLRIIYKKMFDEIKCFLLNIMFFLLYTVSISIINHTFSLEHFILIVLCQ